MSDTVIAVTATAVASLAGGGGVVAWFMARSNKSLIEAQVAKVVQEVYGATVDHQQKEIVELRTDLAAATDEIDKLRREVRILRSEKDLSDAHLMDALAVVDQLLVHDAQHEHNEDLQPPTIPRTLRALIERGAG